MLGWIKPWNSHEALAARVAAIREAKEAVKSDIVTEMSNVSESIAQLKEHHGKLGQLHGEAHSI